MWLRKLASLRTLSEFGYGFIADILPARNIDGSQAASFAPSPAGDFGHPYLLEPALQGSKIA